MHYLIKMGIIYVYYYVDLSKYSLGVSLFVNYSGINLIPSCLIFKNTKLFGYPTIKLSSNSIISEFNCYFFVLRPKI